MKIAFIGAGSFGFTRTVIRDILSFPRLADAHLALMDIDEERLAFIGRAAQRIVREGGYPATIESTRDRARALDGASVVVCTILSHGVEVWRRDVEIPERHGLDVCVGDTRGPSGIVRALRTIPVMLGICSDMERLCPAAWLLNYTNPMNMLCRAMQRAGRAKVVGLCHAVQGMASIIAGWLGAGQDEIRRILTGAPDAEFTYTAAGINHQAWYLEYRRRGVDVLPLVREAVRRPQIYAQDPVQAELCRHLGYCVSEGGGHNSEYSPWFRKRPDLVATYCAREGMARNMGLRVYLRQGTEWKRDIQAWLDDPAPLDLRQGAEYAAPIINALQGGQPFRFHGNTANEGFISNLPAEASVEVPVYADARGMHPLAVGALPPQCAALNAANIASEEMAVEAALTGNRDGVFHACAFDPLTAATLSLAEIRAMVDEMLEANREYLPTFARHPA